MTASAGWRPRHAVRRAGCFVRFAAQAAVVTNSGSFVSDPTDAATSGDVVTPTDSGGATADRNPARGMLLLTITSGVYIASGYVITVWLAHHLGPVDFGRYSVVVGIITIVSILVARGVPVAVSRSIASDPETADHTMAVAARLTLALAVAAAAIAVVAAIPLAAALRDSGLRVPLLIGAVAALTYGLQALLLAWFTGMHRYGRQAFAQSWYAASRLVMIILGGILLGLTGAVAGFVLAPAIAALATVTGIRVRRDHLRRGAPPPPQASQPATKRKLLRASAPLVGVAALVAALLTVDLLAFKRVGTASDVGRYAAAAAIAHVPFFLLRSAPLVLMPAVAAAAATTSHSSGHGLSEPVRAEIRRGVGDSVVLLALPTALLVVLGDRALETLFGASYGVSGLLVAPLTLATAAITLFSVLVAVETALGTLRLALVTGTVGVTLVAVAATIGGEGSDVSRAAWAVAAAATLTLLIHSVSVWARAGSFVPARAVAALAVACAVAGVTLATPRGTSWLAGSALAACAVYSIIALRAGLVRLR